MSNEMTKQMLSASQTYAAMTEEKRRLFRQQLREKQISASRFPIVPFPSRGPRFPLSHAQERLWFLWRLEPDSAMYNIAGAIRLDGELDVDLVRATLQYLVTRHESLRTRFEERDGQACQVVDDMPMAWRFEDLGGVAEGDAAPRAMARLGALTRGPFDLRSAAPFRATLLKLSAQSHVLHFVMHHIVSDAWSSGVLTREFAQVYRALAANAVPDLPALPVQYGDVAAWQREWLDEPAINEQMRYWQSRLRADDTVLELPVTRKRTGLRGSDGARVAATLPVATTGLLRRLSQRQDATLFMTLLAAYGVLLARYARESDIQIGVPAAGRDRAETAGLVGFFVNTLVIRADLANATRFDHLVGQVRERVLEAQDHQDLPFAKLVDAFAPVRSLSHTPLFQAMFNYAGANQGATGLPGLTVTDMTPDLDTARFDLVLNVVEGDALSISLTYARDIFDGAVVARMLGHYLEILNQVAADETRPLGAITLSVEGPWRTSVPTTEVGPECEVPSEAEFETVARRIAAQARSNPEAPAVHCEGERLSYGELDGWARRVGRRLMASGVGADDRVGICMTRSAGVIAALLGVMKSGAAFVPLDPEYPEDRLAYMMEDAGVTRVLADAATLARLSELLAGKAVIDIGSVAGVTSEADFANATETASARNVEDADDVNHATFETAVHPDQLAYVIYTSGSTGRPKGVAISHRSLSLHLNDFIGTYDITRDDRQLQSSTINFDVALHEMLPALMQGGQVEMRGPHLWDLETTSRHLAEERVTFSRIPTAYWQQWLRDPPSRERLSALRQITVGGEGLPGDALRQWREGPLSSIQLDNLYGPTETTVACMYRRTQASDVDQVIVSIGVPYPSRVVYVMDDAGNEVPVGGLGELCVGGNTLARGYLGRPGQSAEKFIPDPFRGDGSRLYRTGDLCRRREDGTIDFLGRIDQQVKLRGFRIELGEIEAALRQVAGVREAAVELRGTGDGKHLVGYVSGEHGATAALTDMSSGPSTGSLIDAATDTAADASVTLSAERLRIALEGKLPGYMVPSAFVVLAHLPVMPNGKVDRRALPEPVVMAGDHYTAPLGALETRLAQVWADVLGVERIGRYDNFFARGGDSIRSLKAVALMQRDGIAVTPRQMFEHQNVISLALAISAARAQGTDIDSAVPLVALSTEERRVLPLSFAQQRLWFLWNLQPDSSAYHIPAAIKLTGVLDLDAVRGSFDRLVERHEALRTTFVADGDGRGNASQVIAATPRYDYRTFDAADHPDCDAVASAAFSVESRVRAWADALAAEPFDLMAGPLLRVGVARTAPAEHVLVVVMHHIVSDGWSVGVLLREFVDGYRARAANTRDAQDAPNAPDSLTPLPIQYADYAVWQRRWLAAGEEARQLAYWRDRLGGKQPVLTLPADRPRQALGVWRAATETIALPASLCNALHRVAREHHATPFVVLLAAFNALLHRHTGEPDIRVGVPVANRHRAETAGLIGFFVNTQVLKADVNARMTLGELVDQVRTHALDAQAHQDLPFDVLVDALQPERSLSHTPLFQVVFNHQRHDYQAVNELDALAVERYLIGDGGAQFELTLNTQEAPDGTLSASFRYARELFDAQTMQRFARHYQRVLEAFAEDSPCRIDEIELLDVNERASLTASSRADAAYAERRPVHQVIRSQAQATPDATAVVFGGEALSYRDLEARASRLAYRLAALGVRAEVRVGIALERSIDMVVGLLAILKAGGAYVPLDPDYPRDRLSYMIEDSGIGLLLTHSHLRGELPLPTLTTKATKATTAAELTVLDLDLLDLSTGPLWSGNNLEGDRKGDSNLDPAVTINGENAAYVIYTSGSTGRPKGVVNRHGALTNRIVWMQDAYGLNAADAVLQKTPFSFDVSVWEFFWPLMFGAKLVVAKPGDHRDPARLIELIQGEGVTTLHFVPSMLQAFVAHLADDARDDDASACAGLKRIICSGEALQAELANRALTLLPQANVYNLYGPTEAAIDVTHWTCVADADSVPIGAPIANVQTYVLDDALNLVPRGVAGELYLGGVGLARGYLNRAALTAERFVPDPFGRHGERLYRTGDLTRWNAAGALDYLGRIDHQVKIRGFRIELGEIESQLSAQNGVREAVVSAQDGPGGMRLVAYVSGQVSAQMRAPVTGSEARLNAGSEAGSKAESEPARLDAQALRMALGKTLPDYMVPSVIVVLDNLPLSPNGKVDRKALPKAEIAFAPEYEAPHGRTEETLAAIWREVLGLERVGRHDNFFELGGDSILSLRVVARVRDAGWSVTPRQVFEHQALAALAANLAAHPIPASSTTADVSIITAVPAAERGAAPLPLSHAQQRLWFLWNLQPDSRAYHIDGALKLSGDLDIDALRGSFDALVARHESLRTTFAAGVDGATVQVIASPDTARCDCHWVDLGGTGAGARSRAGVVDVHVEHGAALSAWASALSSAPFDLTTGPLLRVGVARLADTEHLLLIVMHHIISDGWSIGVLLREFVAGYQARVAGDRHAMPAALPIQYADYALWQRRWLAAGEQERQLAYWHGLLGNAQPVLALPVDRARQALGAYRAQSTEVALRPGLAQALRHVAREQDATLFMVLLAAFDVLLYRHTGETDIRVGVPVANRDRVETENVIGFFVNTQVQKADIDGRMTLAALIDQVRGRALDAQAHPDLPFDVLVDALQPERSLSHTPLFQVAFNHQRNDYRVLEQLPGLSIGGYDLGEGAAQFELTLNTQEYPDGSLTVSLRYARELFDATTMQRFGHHYARVLEAWVSDPQQRIDAIELLDGTERNALLAWGRQNAAPANAHADAHANANANANADASVAPDVLSDARPNITLVHDRIRERALAAPESIALVYGEQSLCYGELDARANRLAHRLMQHGVGPEARVGIALERSIEMIVGLLAILKAGGAYVPLDPDYPRDRLSYMIEDSGITLLLTHNDVRARLPVPSGLDVLVLDVLDLSEEPDVPPAVSISAANLAYVIYTSGSTGRPKGAQLSHHNVARLFDATGHWFGFGPADVWTMFHSFAFDFSVWEIFGALCHGGRLVVVPFAVSRSPEEFLALLRRERVTILNQTPSAFRQLMAAPGLYDGEPLALREVIFGGEALELETLRRWIAHFGDATPRLVNMYGITETTVHVTYRPIRAADLDAGAGGNSPVGERIPDLDIFVLDAECKLVPTGVAGELHVGGSGVARGYLNRPGLSAERFVPDPFGQRGERLYRTGDLARWTANGALEYLGRIDHQVKIRGFRIELGEIDAQLLAQAGVRESLTLAQEAPGGTRLVSYVTLDADQANQALDARTLRSALARILPDYMIPAVIVVLDALPLTPNGKVDRKALPHAQIEAASAYEAPQGEAEEALAAIWRDVLGIERVGRHDNFFELGGDSILSLQIVSRARAAGWKITPRQLFERQTIGLLESVARRTVDADASAEGAEADQAGVALLPIQSWFFDMPMTNRHHWNQAVLLEGTQVPERRALSQALGAVVSHHGALRTRFLQDEQGVWGQARAAGTDDAAMHAADGAGDHAIDDATDNATDNAAATTALDAELLWEREAADAADIDALCDVAQRSLDLHDGPLLRAVLIRLPAGAWRLLLVIHHLAVDGVSWRILLSDLQAAYEQALADSPITLPPNGTSYQAWSNRLAAHARDATVRAELAYWRKTVEQPSWVPVDRAAGSATWADLRAVSHHLDGDATHRLLQVVPAAYRTQINDVLLTALGRALCTWAGGTSIRIDVEGHGREDLFEDVDLSRTVGWFTSLYPVTLEALGEPGVALMRVKEALRAVPQRGLGFGLLKYLGENDDRAALSDSTRSSVVFNYLGQFDRSFATDTGWRPAGEASGRVQDEHAALTHELSINAKIFDGKLSVSIGYSGARYDAATIETLLHAYLNELKTLIAWCTSGATGITPSDFPLASLTQAAIDALPMPASSIEDLYPLSPLQSGMLFHTLLAPGGSAYLNQLRIDIDGLDVPRFRAAWEAATARHTILRTGFVQQNDQWLQWVARDVALPFVEHDGCERAAGDDVAGMLDALSAAELSRGFDLMAPPLQRLVLVRTDTDADTRRHHLIWTHHHVLMDGWSVSRLMGEVLRHYDARALPAHGGRYRDYIGWLHGRDAHASETYWRGVLSGLDEPTRLISATDSARAAASDPSSAEVSSGQGEHLFALDPAATTRLVAFARACRVTVNTLVQAAWSLVLQRHTGHASVVFGATVAGRPGDLPGAEQLLGLFINTVPVVTAPRADAALGDWLLTLQAQGIASQEHAHTPLYEIQTWSGTGQDGLFDTLLVFENYPVDEALKETAPDGLAFGELAFREETNYPLTIGVTLGERLLVATSYARARLAPSTVERFAAQLGAALAGFVALGASAKVGDVSLLDADALHGLLLLGRNETVYPPAIPVHRAIGLQAAAMPDALALVLDDIALDYRALDERANRVSHRLMTLGVGPEVCVGIALARSIDMVVAILATLKAGGAYVPLDPDYPRDRLAYMIEDSRIGLLLTHDRVRDRLPVSASVQILDLDTLDVSNEPVSAPDVLVSDDMLAYVIYTSGSTGRPKGVGVPHGAFARHVQVSVDMFGLVPADRVMQFSTLNFDGFVEQLFPALTVGARVVLRGPALWDSSTFREQIIRHGISVADVTTAYWQLLVQDLDNGSLPDLGGLRRIHAGGEAMSPQALHVWQQLPVAAIALANTYGPTEAAVTASAYECDAAVNAGGRLATVPIGRPLGGRHIYLLDDALSMVPPGAIGELCIGGALLARGYLNRPGLSAERFVPDPFGEGDRVYRTGDLARWNADGALEYVGRIDHQVKIRGFRIELGEIEACLLAQPDVREAIAVAVSRPGGEQIAAYVSPAAGRTLDGRALRGALATALPDYMVPSVVAVLDALPLNRSGKVDRHALPEANLDQAREIEAPQGPLESAIAGIWEEVLGIDRVGRHDHFFDLGGHSLLVMQVASRLKHRLGMAAPLATLFANLTIARLAPALSGEQTVLADRTPISRSTQALTRIPLSHAQDRLWFLWKLDAQSAAYNTVGATRLDGELRVAAMRAAIDAVVARHDVLRTRFEEQDGVAWQVVSEWPDEVLEGEHDEKPYAWEEYELADGADTALEQDASLRALLRDLSLRPFDLKRGPLLRVTLIRCSARSHVLHFAMHHIVSDAWSLDILKQEFAHAYETFCRGVRPQWAPLPIQYGDYASWQREWLDERVIDTQLGYWRQRLGTEHPVLELPVARKRTGLRSADGGRVTLMLTPELSAALHRLSRRRGATLFMTLLAAYDVLLARYCGQKDIRIGVPAAGRDRLETEGLIGFFVNTLVIRSELAGIADFSALLAHVNERVVEAQAHQDLPFAQIVDALQPSRSLSHTPLFQAMFNYAEADRTEVTLPGLTATGLSGEAETARFDLVLNVFDGESIAVSLTYARDIFDNAVVERMLAHYAEILAQVATDEAVPLGAIALSVAGPWRVPARASAEGRVFEPAFEPAFEPVTRRIAAQAHANPGAPAVHCEGERLSRGALERWANRLGRHLAASGVRADERVGICMTRSAAVIASLLGVMKSGAAFVPLDPEYPEDRLAYMMEDAGVTRVLADAATARRLSGLLAGREVIDVGGAAGAAGMASVSGVDTNADADALDASEAAFERAVHPDQLAYVIYTSGSTGRPKGVAISHRSLSLHLNDFVTTYGITSADRQLQSSTINFDVALHEMLPALMQGGEVEMRGPQLWDLETTSRHLAEERVTFSRIPTAYWQQWLRDPPSRERLAALRQITVGGEGLPGDALRQWRDGPLSGIRLDNLYGPTETTVACMYRQTQASDVDQVIVSIGVPYASRVVYVMDDTGNEVPVGALGELCIGGSTLARGYLGRAGQSAEKFIPDPFRAEGARLYRTGDLCRRREDGTIDFLGRIDQQVKLRGFRIELGEIEAALRQVAGVREAVVALRGTGEGKHLVGYVSGATLSVEMLRLGLEGKLPGYMVPSTFVVLERLPVMQNGKVDRQALPEPEAAAGEHYTAPVGALETKLARIWSDVLGVERVGRHDNFFERGGDSVRALSLAAIAVKRGIRGLSLESLFTYQTIASLAVHVGIDTGLPGNIVALNVSSSERTVFMIHPGYGLVNEYRPLAAGLAKTARVYGVQSPIFTEDDWNPRTATEFIDDYVARIRAVQPTGSYALMGWSMGGPIAVAVASRLEAQGELVDWVGLLDANVPLEHPTSHAHHVSQVDDAVPGAWREVDETEVERVLRSAGADRSQTSQASGWYGEPIAHDDARMLARKAVQVGQHYHAIDPVLQGVTLAAPLYAWWAADTDALCLDDENRRWCEALGKDGMWSQVIDGDHAGMLRSTALQHSVNESLNVILGGISSGISGVMSVVNRESSADVGVNVSADVSADVSANVSPDASDRLDRDVSNDEVEPA